MLRAAVDTLIRPFFTARFVKFGLVGASGVVVNLAALRLLLGAGVHTNVASAIAIEVSLLSNFTINFAWTFRDRRDQGSVWRQGARFHLVCLVGAVIQWLVFVAMNVVWLLLVMPVDARSAYHVGTESYLERWIWHPLVSPPAVGRWVYASQLVGIGCGMFWNYLLNYYWTWSAGRAAAGSPPGVHGRAASRGVDADGAPDPGAAAVMNTEELHG